MNLISVKKFIYSFYIWVSKMISLTVIIFIILELVSSQTIKFIPMITGILNSRSLINIELDSRVNSPQYTDKIYAKLIFSDLSQSYQRYNPYTIWISGEMKSQTLNINNNGIRKTYNFSINQTSINNNKKIYIFGASTVFGEGTDDNTTIPSFLSKIINNKSNNHYELVNFGTRAYSNSQELNRLIIELRNNNIPDYVIFYNGIADILYGSYNPGIPGAHSHYYETALRYNHRGLLNIIYSSYTLRLIGYIEERIFQRNNIIATKDIDTKITDTLNIYKKNIEIVHALSKTFGFKYYFFFQPVLATSNKPKTSYEQIIYSNGGVLNIVFKKAWDKIKFIDFNGYNFYNISDVFDNIDKEVYIDFAHLGAFGNEIIAQTIYDKIRKDIW